MSPLSDGTGTGPVGRTRQPSATGTVPIPNRQSLKDFVHDIGLSPNSINGTFECPISTSRRRRSFSSALGLLVHVERLSLGDVHDIDRGEQLAVVEKVAWNHSYDISSSQLLVYRPRPDSSAFPLEHVAFALQHRSAFCRSVYYQTLLVDPVGGLVEHAEMTILTREDIGQAIVEHSAVLKPSSYRKSPGTKCRSDTRGSSTAVFPGFPGPLQKN
ncbi:hypothetical protein C8J56DRAFT_1103040 [Mycena floridula]|nr:hypothetical protein C8J56DRAFT_1103040 [Mycena floridula]